MSDRDRAQQVVRLGALLALIGFALSVVSPFPAVLTLWIQLVCFLLAVLLIGAYLLARFRQRRGS